MTYVSRSSDGSDSTAPTTGTDPVTVVERPIAGPDDEDLAARLRPEPPPSRVVGVLTRTLAALALLSVGMVGGVLLQQHAGSTGAPSGAATSGTFPGGFGGVGGGLGGAGGGPPAGFQPRTGGAPAGG